MTLRPLDFSLNRPQTDATRPPNEVPPASPASPASPAAADDEAIPPGCADPAEANPPEAAEDEEIPAARRAAPLPPMQEPASPIPPPEPAPAASASLGDKVRAWLSAEENRPWVGRLLSLATLCLVFSWLAFKDSPPKHPPPTAPSPARQAAHAAPKIVIPPARSGPVTAEQVGRLLRGAPRPAPPQRQEPSLPHFESPSLEDAAPVSPPALLPMATKEEARVVSPRPARPAPRLRAVPAAPPPLPRPRLPIRLGQLYKTGGMIAASVESAAARPVLDLPVGEKVAVRLQEGLSSSYPTTVLARATRDVAYEGRLVLRKGDIIKGRFTADAERIYIRFFEITTGGSAYRMVGHAQEGGLPGVVAQRREATLADKGRAGAVQGAAQATGEAISDVGSALAEQTLPGRIAARVAGTVAGQTLSEVQRNAQATSPVILLIQAGKTFDVVVTED